MIIALASYRFINGDVDFNIRQMEHALRAAQGRAELVCFGEAFLQGFDAMNWAYAHDRAVALAQDDAVIDRLRALTRAYGVDLLFGYLERSGALLYSSCTVIARGEIIHNNRRLSAGWKECGLTDSRYREGDESREFLYRGRLLRIALCGDLFEFTEKFRTSGVVIWPVCCNYDPQTWRDAAESEYIAQARLAAERVLFVDAIDHESDCPCAAFDFAAGRIRARLPAADEGILYVEI